jgi:class 3 adenylate cyclase/predicted ATPase
VADTACPACGSEIAPVARFCSQCGVRLTKDDAERRHLTVLFCDLADSTELSERLDPEDLGELVREYHMTCAREIAREGGHVSQYLGDGMLVFFGYPLAHEDDAARAVRAALGLLESVRRVNAGLAKDLGVALALRIGIDSGPVVIGAARDAGHRETQALGQTMNRAARLQSIAPHGGVVVSDATLRRIPGLFVTRSLGAQKLKGISDELIAHQVLRASGTRGALEVQDSSRLTPLAGRREEIEQCAERWRSARDGNGQALLIEGEAGLGKSRLVRVLRDHVVGADDHVWIECRGAPQHADSALYPVIDVLERTLDFASADTPQVRIARLRRAVEETGIDVADTLPLLTALLSLPTPEGFEEAPSTPELKRRRTLSALVRWLVARAQQAPVAFVVEDLHWVDASTLEFLDRVVQEIPGHRLLFVGTARPGFESPWREYPAYTQLHLSPLGADDVRGMITSIAHGKSLPEEVVRELVARTDGTPIFVEELTKMVLESGILEEHEGGYELRGAFPRLAIPETLQDSLTARLDRLAPVKGVAQLAATIGRGFSYELIAAVSGVSDATLQAALRELVAADILIERREGTSRSEYSFRHALIQEAAYGSLLRERRRKLHGQIAEVLRARFPDLAQQHPEVLAHHLQEAGVIGEAIASWRAAGAQAVARSAMVEAVHHFRRALDLLAAELEGPDRDRVELALQASVSIPVIATLGYGTAEAEHAISRARELCERLGDGPEHFPVLRGVWTFYEVRANYRAALEVAERLVSLAELSRDAALTVGANHSIGITNLFLGRFEHAREQLERAVALYDPERQRALISLTPMDPGVGARGFGALARWFAGRPDAALELAESSQSLARGLGPFNLTWALVLSGWVHLLRGDWAEARSRAEAATAMSNEQGFRNSAGLAMLIEGHARVRLGDPKGLEVLREGLATWRDTGTEMGRTMFLCWQADACIELHLPAEASDALDQAVLCAERGSERFVEAEILRLRGELVQQAGDLDGAAPWFERSLEIARQQGAASLALRAATSAARLGQSCGRKEEARARLEPVYSDFREGASTRDLRRAHELLATL